MTDQVFHGSILAAVAALVSGCTWALVKLSRWLATKTKNQDIGMFSMRLGDLASRVVRDVYQTTVKPFQDNGNWGPETQASAKALAIGKLKSYLGPDGLRMLEWVAGMGGKQSLDEFLGTYVEAAVVDAKLQGQAVAAVRPTLPPPVPVSPS